jgi:hypothetical protein
VAGGRRGADPTRVCAASVYATVITRRHLIDVVVDYFRVGRATARVSVSEKLPFPSAGSNRTSTSFFASVKLTTLT